MTDSVFRRRLDNPAESLLEFGIVRLLRLLRVLLSQYPEFLWNYSSDIIDFTLEAESEAFLISRKAGMGRSYLCLSQIMID